MSFSFETTSYGNPENVAYQYRLLGADSKWINNGKSNKTTFATLSPGNYKLEVKSSNNHNVWGKAATYTFLIKPPFWKTIWFILILATLVIADKAFTYLTKFSRLLRKVLVSSENSQIMLDDELDLLKNYIELEGLRFGNTFSYRFDIDKNIELEEISIPSLMIQPFIENAIWHGLLHKKGSRKLLIHFAEKENTLICTVDDNGVGRKEAKKIKQWRDKDNYESKGMKLIKDRLDIIRSQSSD